MSDANHPVKVFRAGYMSAACWKNENPEDGRIRWSIKTQKRIQDKNEEWRTTDHLFPSDLADLILVTQHALAFVRLRESEEDRDLPTVAA
jgi:hypothetical protein